MDEYVNVKWTILNAARASSLACEDCDLAGVPNDTPGVLALHLRQHPSHRIVVTDVETRVTRIESDLDDDQAAAPVVPMQGEGKG